MKVLLVTLLHLLAAKAIIASVCVGLPWDNGEKVNLFNTGKVSN